MSETQVSSTNSTPVPYMQKPVFIIDSFDGTKEEHLKGMITIKMNRKQATDLCTLIRECELGQEEGHLYAMQGHIRRWYDIRRRESQQSKAVVIRTDNPPR